ncbi:ABC transporter substrate-binding protein, partial [Candidatus Margulisiibacteriota bacterium]
MKKTLLIFFMGIMVITFCNPAFSVTKNLRIISMAPATTEILFSLGLDEEIVGVTSFCNYPPQALRKENIGSFSRPNIEKILSLKPDIVFATDLEQGFAVSKLMKLGVNVFISSPTSISELFDSIRFIGIKTDKEEKAEQLIHQMHTRIAAITGNAMSESQNNKPKVFVEIWHDPLMTAGKGSFIDELITLAGGENIAFDTPRPYCYFSAEQVIKRNPDYIILGYMNRGKPVNMVGSRPGWQNIKAVKNNRVYNDINPDIFLRP